MALIVPLKSKKPRWGPESFIAGSADLIGDVTLGNNVSIWYRCVLRGDVMPIVVGNETNIQDGSIIHGTYKKCGAVIGDSVTVGHGVLLHGCAIGDRCLIGMGSIVMDQVKVGANSIVAAGSLLTEGSEFPENSLILGRPGRVKRSLSESELAFLGQSANNYLLYKDWYTKGESNDE